MPRGIPGRPALSIYMASTISILTLSTHRMSTLKSAICIAVLLDIKVTFLPAIDKSNHKLVAKAMYEVRYIDLDDR
ncbi:hypothetical protein AAG906_035876 [Vitis piasezkii]